MHKLKKSMSKKWSTLSSSKLKQPPLSSQLGKMKEEDEEDDDNEDKKENDVAGVNLLSRAQKGNDDDVKVDREALRPLVTAPDALKASAASTSSSSTSSSSDSPLKRPRSSTPPASATPSASSSASKCRKVAPLSHTFGRHRVLSVTERLQELELSLWPVEEDEKGDPAKLDPDVSSLLARACHLRGSWRNTNVSVGDTVHVLADFRPEQFAFVVDDLHGLLVVHPDALVSGTSVVSSLFCLRKAVLNEQFKGLEGSSKTMFIGTLVHELLQACLKHLAETDQAIRAHLDSILSTGPILQTLLTLNMSLAEVKQEVEPFLAHILYFTEKYVLGRPATLPPPAFSSSSSQPQPTNRRPPPPPSVWPGRVEAVQDIEENIWSPRLGVKGKIDLTVQVKLHGKDKQGRTTKTMPLELKTGRASGSAEHRGQVIVYSMMMSERRPDPESGLLLYLRNSSLQEVPAGLHEMRGLIQLRNDLASNLRAKTASGDEAGDWAWPREAALPDPINLKRACGQCPHLLACALQQKITKTIPEAPHAMAELAPAALEHLTPAHLEFYEKHKTLCALEREEDSKRSKLRSLWCETPRQREQNGLCAADLCLARPRPAGQDPNRHTFTRPLSSLPSSVLKSGETVLVSSDRELALSQGIVLDVSEREVCVALDRDLYATSSDDDKPAYYHLDQYVYQGSMSSNLVSLIRLMSPSPAAERLRRLVIDREPATFLKGLGKEVVTAGKHILRPLNRAQQKAVFRTLMAEQYVLLKGMPGTGKTTMIVALVRLLAAMGKSVLLTSYTHSAVDNILLKLARHGDVKFLRLGRQSRVHADLVNYSAERLAADYKDVHALKQFYLGYNVVATTCLGLNHPAVQQRTFDFCILDEAGQSLLLSALGPLFHAQRFVLVGDPQQLPPVVQSTTARKLGMDVSLFSHLQTDDNTIPLNIQYRMNSDIMASANHLTYDGQLECGSDAVAGHTLATTKAAADGDVPAWADDVLSPELSRSVVFLDTSALGHASLEAATPHGGVSNRAEAELVKKVTALIFRRAYGDVSVGVIAPYRAQIDLLKQKLDARADVNTVDQFQGKDKDVIVYSCVRSRADAKKKDGQDMAKDILSDARRLNVAMTRARCKLILVGHRKTLEAGYGNFQKLFAGWDESKFRVLTAEDGVL